MQVVHAVAWCREQLPRDERLGALQEEECRASFCSLPRPPLHAHFRFVAVSANLEGAL